MFYYLDGTVAEIQPYLAVIDCGGVGYACATTNHTLASLEKGKRARLYTHLHVREEALSLYGFATMNELNSFRMLLSISGVGPKAALAILSVSTPAELAMAIITGDEKALTVAPGIGKRIAQRIILELKDKMAKEQAAGNFGTASASAIGGAAFSKKAREAAAALSVLGYTQQDVAIAMKDVDAVNLPLEEIIRQSLKKMATV